MSPEDEKLLKFNQQVLSVLKLIRQELQNDKELVEAVEPPSDWPTIQATLRSVAEDLMIAASVDEAIRLLKQDPKSALTAVVWAMGLKTETARKVIRHAHAKAPDDFSTLPCLPLAVFLIEAIESLEVPRAF